jgi:hypothetical protein
VSEITLFKNGLPSYLKNITLDEDTRAVAGSSSNKRISIRGGAFRMIVDGEEIVVSDDRHIPVVIVRMAHKPSRTFYEGAYKEGEKVAPACWSTDGEKPDAGVESPQSSACMTCPQNIKGSGSGDSRACRFSQRLAVVLANDLEGDIYQLVLPATSIFGKGEKNKWPFLAYVKFLAGHGVPIGAAVTEMRFDAKAAVPTLTFRPLEPLQEEQYDVIRARGDDPAAVAALKMTVAQVDKVPALPPSFAKKSDAPAAEEAPVKRAAPKAADRPVKEASDVDDILDAWEDE